MTPARLAHSRREQLLIGVSAVVAVVIAWEIAGRFNLVNSRFTSYPTEVISEGLALVNSRQFGQHLGVSALEFLLGMAAALAVGVPLGLLIGRFRRLKMMFDPILTVMDVTPRLAFVPILIIWVGIGVPSKAGIVFLGAVFPLIINLIAGIKAIHPTWVSAARSYGASEWAIFWKVLFPGTLPYFFTGLRLSLGRGLLGVIVGEMYVSTMGIGNLIMSSGASFRVGRLMFLVFFVATLGWLMVAVVNRIAQRTVRWKA